MQGDPKAVSPVSPTMNVEGVCAQAAKRWHALTSLKELDVSYCSLSTAVLANVIARGSTLQVLAQPCMFHQIHFAIMHMAVHPTPYCLCSALLHCRIPASRWCWLIRKGCSCPSQ